MYMYNLYHNLANSNSEKKQKLFINGWKIKHFTVVLGSHFQYYHTLQWTVRGILMCRVLSMKHYVWRTSTTRTFSHLQAYVLGRMPCHWWYCLTWSMEIYSHISGMTKMYVLNLGCICFLYIVLAISLLLFFCAVLMITLFTVNNLPLTFVIGLYSWGQKSFPFVKKVTVL